MKMKTSGSTRARTTFLAFAAAAFALPVPAQVRETKRLDACERVLREVAGMPESIPRDLLDKAECVAVIPGVKKAALGVGGRFGKGAVVCRTEGGRGPWGPPLMIGIGGASIGFQIGGQSSDFVFLIMNPKGIDHLLKNQFTLGADVSVAAGPKGRSAEAATDVLLNAEILTYSRSKGLFAGVSLEGAVVKQDKGANQAVYGAKVDPGELLLKSGHPVPAAARGLVKALAELSPRGAQ
jgi:lipid-binding SYLF domain-containing protein